jgi:catechol 2,3-dioxygenase-like lactoylglutathione lyase family enzyme
MAITQFYHVSLCVADLSRSVAFYRDVLGLRVAGEFDFAGPEIGRVLAVGDCRVKAAFLSRDGIRLELLAFERPAALRPGEPAANNRLGLAHLTFSVDDLDATLQSLRDRGVPILSETRAELGPGVAACSVRDPDGLLIELFQHPAGVASPYDAVD